MRSFLHRHSTLFGLSTSALASAAIGALTHWNPDFMMLSLFGGLFIFPKLFYGLRESRKLDNDPFEPGSGCDGFARNDMAGIGAKANLHVEAYDKARMAGIDEAGHFSDASALRKFAEEDR